MTNPMDTVQVRNAYLLPYTNDTRQLYTYQLDRWCLVERAAPPSALA